MNKRGHVLNAVLLAIGVGYVLDPSGDVSTFRLIAEISLPITLGALFPDVDTAFGKHRKTLHNLPVLVVFYTWPAVFGNLQFVWIGVLTHYVLDLLGSTRGIALFYPLEREYDLPLGVPVSSRWAGIVTVVVTGIEVGIVFAVVHFRLPVQDLSRQLVTVFGV